MRLFISLMKYLFVIFFSMMTIAQAEISLREHNNLYCYDGDTCYVSINGKNEKIRLLEIDTPEISNPQCNAELELGLKARDFVNDLIQNAETIEFRTDYETDYFGRILSYLIIDGKDVSTLLLKNGLGAVYKKGDKMVWCEN